MLLEVFTGTYKFIKVQTCLHKETVLVAASVFSLLAHL